MKHPGREKWNKDALLRDVSEMNAQILVIIIYYINIHHFCLLQSGLGQSVHHTFNQPHLPLIRDVMMYSVVIILDRITPREDLIIFQVSPSLSPDQTPEALARVLHRNYSRCTTSHCSPQDRDRRYCPTNFHMIRLTASYDTGREERW